MKISYAITVCNEYNSHYICRFMSGSNADSICAVHKNDCEEVHLGRYDTNDKIYMKT